MVKQLTIPPDGRERWACRDSRYSSGQWLLLSAIVAAIGLGVIMILLNTAVLNGHSSIISIGSFPKNDIRDLRSSSVQEAVILSSKINGDGSVDKSDEFNASYGRFVSEISELYNAHGALTDINYVPNEVVITLVNGTNVGKIINVSLKISYYNRDTIYIENVTVGT